MNTAKPTCYRCGTQNNVFTDLVFDRNRNSYTIHPVCINCKKSDLELDNTIRWEHNLKEIEHDVAEQIISKRFPNIKFKESAIKTLMRLMRKYSVRCVFEICMLLRSGFNANIIAQKCHKKFTS